MKRHISQLILSTALPCIMSTAAMAQQVAADATAPKATGLEEIVVTATKTGATQLQKTPVAISAFSAANLESSGITNVRDLMEYTPNLDVSAATTNAEIYIRGVGSNNVFAGSDPDVTVQVDGVYIARPSAQFGDYIDVDRVEVLRGPQGTLYGRNAVGGTINVISIKPTDDFAAKEQLSVGDYSMVHEQAYVSGPLIKGLLQGSLAIDYIRHDPYVQNVIAGQPGLFDQNHGSIRGQLRFEPTDFIDATTRFDWMALNEHYEGFNALLAPYPAAPIANSLLGNFFKTATNFPQKTLNRAGGISEDINIQLDPNLTLKSITAYRKTRFQLTADIDATENFVNNGGQEEDDRQISQEFNLNGHYGNLDAVAGLYYFHEDEGLNIYAIVPGAEKNTVPSIWSTSEAAFTQGTYHVLPDVALTVGVRYTQETKHMDSDFLAYRVPSAVSLPGFPFTSSKTIHDYAVTPKFGIDWQITPDAMVYFSATKGYKSGGLNYAAATVLAQAFAPEKLWSYEVGTKTDWFDHRLRANLTGFMYDYSNLQVQAIIGPGVISIGNAANATIRGLEAEFSAKPIPAVQLTANLSTLSATYDSFPGASVPTALIPFVSRSPNYIASTATYNAAGNKLNDAPSFTALLAAQYTYDMADRGSLVGRAEYSWKDRVYFDPSNADIMSQAPYGIVNLSVQYLTSDGDWRAQLWLKNVTNKQYVTTVGANGVEPAGLVGAPRTVGVTVTRSW